MPIPGWARSHFSHVLSVSGPSCRFTLTYDSEGHIAKVESDYGVAEALTEHAITVLDKRDFDHWHVACRHPLDVQRVLHPPDRRRTTVQR